MRKITLILSLIVLLSCFKKNITMNIEINNFVNNKFTPDANIKELILFSDSNSWVVIPPTSVIDSAGFDSRDFNLSFIEIRDFKSLESFYCKNLPIKSLPKDLFQLNNIELIQVAYSPNADITEEVKGLKKINSLKELIITGSVISEDNYFFIKRHLNNVKVIW